MAKKLYVILLVAAAASIMLGFILMGAGHGWVTSFYFSFFPLILTPVVGFGFTNNKKLVLLFIIVAYFFVSYVFYFKTLEEGKEYFERVLNGITGWVILFLSIWFVPLMISIYGLIKKPNILKSVQESR